MSCCIFVVKLQVCIFTLFTILCLPLEIIDWSVVTLTIRIYSSPSTNQRPAAYQHVKLRRDIELTGRQTQTTRQEGRRYTDPIQIVYLPTPFDNVSLFVYFYLHVSLLTTRMFFTTLATAPGSALRRGISYETELSRVHFENFDISRHVFSFF